MKNKRIFIVGSIVALIISIPCFVYGGMFFTHFMIINSTPDTSNWILTNDDYTICPVIDDESVTFNVEDKDGNVVFTCEESWRDWDFKRIDIDQNNVITADSSDVGTYIYKEDDNGSFYLYSPVY